ncbi:MAG: hypothetical protein ABJ251_00475 [Paracoccaceae bacterium]
MRAVFHIGRPKCGTTSIQVFLQENRDRLSKQGVLYSRSDDEISSQWEFPIAALCQNNQAIPDPFVSRLLDFHDQADQDAYSAAKLSEFDQLLEKHSATHHTWVGSSEHATPYLSHPEHVAALNTMLKERFDEVRYVLHVRRQEDLVASAFAEGVRRGDPIGLNEYVDRVLEKHRFNHMWLTRIWTEVTEKDQLSVRLLEPDALIDGDLCRDFANILDVDTSDFAFPDPANLGPASRTLPYVLFLNRMVADAGQRTRIRRQIREFGVNLVNRVFGNGPKMKLDHDTIARIRKHSAASNEKLRKAFFPERSELFPEPTPRKSLHNQTTHQSVATF